MEDSVAFISIWVSCIGIAVFLDGLRSNIKLRLSIHHVPTLSRQLCNLGTTWPLINILQEFIQGVIFPLGLSLDLRDSSERSPSRWRL